jgi:hypothetical protein
MRTNTLQSILRLCLSLCLFAHCNSGAKFPDNLSKIKKGMSPAEVERLIGKPERIENMDLGAIDFKRWVYNPGDVMVDFAYGKVEKVVTEKDRFKPGEPIFKQSLITLKVDPTLSEHAQDLQIIYDDKETCPATCKALLEGTDLRIFITDNEQKPHRLQDFKINLQVHPDNKVEGNYFYTDTDAKLKPSNMVGFSPNLEISLSSNSFKKGTEIYGYLKTLSAITDEEGPFVNVSGYFKCKIE